jgi:hypothetical protein
MEMITSIAWQERMATTSAGLTVSSSLILGRDLEAR